MGIEPNGNYFGPNGYQIKYILNQMGIILDQMGIRPNGY